MSAHNNIREGKKTFAQTDGFVNISALGEGRGRKKCWRRLIA